MAPVTAHRKRNQLLSNSLLLQDPEFWLSATQLTDQSQSLTRALPNISTIAISKKLQGSREYNERLESRICPRRYSAMVGYLVYRVRRRQIQETKYRERFLVQRCDRDPVEGGL